MYLGGNFLFVRCLFVLGGEKVTILRQFQLKNGNFSARNRAIFSVLYNISSLNFAILLISRPFSTCKRFRSSCLVRPLIYYANSLLFCPINFFCHQIHFNRNSSPRTPLKWPSYLSTENERNRLI